MEQQQQKQQQQESPVAPNSQSLNREEIFVREGDDDNDHQVEFSLQDISNQHAMIPPCAAAGAHDCGGTPRKSNNNNVDDNHDDKHSNDDSKGTDLCSSSDDQSLESCKLRIRRSTSRQSMFSMSSTPSFSLSLSRLGSVSSLEEDECTGAGDDDDQSFEDQEYFEELEQEEYLVNDMSNMQLHFTKVVRRSDDDENWAHADYEVSLLGTDDDDDDVMDQAGRRPRRRRRSIIEKKTKTVPVSPLPGLSPCVSAPLLLLDAQNWDFDFVTAKSYLINLASQPESSQPENAKPALGGGVNTRLESSSSRSFDSEYTEIEYITEDEDKYEMLEEEIIEEEIIEEEITEEEKVEEEETKAIDETEVLEETEVAQEIEDPLQNSTV